MKKHSNAIFSSIALPILLLLGVVTTHAGPRSSTNYNVVTDTADSGGKRATSTSYTNDGSVGGIVGISTVAAPAETAKHGYVGQLYDVTGLTLTSATPTVNETSTDQLTAWQTLDDLSLLAVSAASITWSVPLGPLAINASGLATAGVVYQNTAATAQGVYAGATGTLGLTVLNSIPDNFGTYASDGLDDAWQVQYFGQNNPAAAPGVDADRDGFSNKFEFDAGLIPTDPASVFHWRMEPVPGHPGQTHIVFSPRLPDRTYTVKTSTNLLSTSWISLSGATFTDNGSERTVTDPDTSGQRKFYKVEITNP